MHKRVKVCVRVRPSAQATGAGVVVNAQEQLTRSAQTISVVTDAATGNGTCFHFDQVLHERVDQRGVFESAARDVVGGVLSGYNGTIMAYGQTGAGKTFTMSGGRQAFEDRGICARAISAIFQHIQRDADHAYAVRVSYVEVYNESLYDLLDLREPAAASGTGHHPALGSSNNARDDHLVIQETEKGQTFIKGLARPLVANEEAAFDLLFQGETNRTIAEHCLNAASTRSHCIFTVYIEKKSALDSTSTGSPDDGVVVYSKLNLVDLAGSERMKKTGVSGVMLKEASHINKSLTFLEQVVIALGDKKRQHIPYRQTTLTNLLKDSLSGNCRTLLLACVWPDASHNDQSLATLKFATRMLRVKTSAVVNVAQSAASRLSTGVASQVVAKYTDEIARLKAELAMYDTLNGKSHVDYDAHAITSPEQQAQYKQDVLRFIADSSAHPLPIVNLLQLQRLFLAFRDVYREQQQQVEVLSARIQQQQQQHPPSYPSSNPTDAPDRPNSASKMIKHLRGLREGSPSHLATSRTASPPLKLPLVTKSTPAAAMMPPVPLEMPESDGPVRRSVALPRIPPEQPILANRPSAAALTDKELFQTFMKLEKPKPESLLDVELAKQNLRHAKAQLAACGLEVNQLKLCDSLMLRCVLR